MQPPFVTTTVYEPCNVALYVCPVALFIWPPSRYHWFPLPDEEVSNKEPPAQMVVGPPTEMLATGLVLIVTTMLPDVAHPLIEATLT